MIPSFPNFKKLEFSDKKEVEEFTSKFPPYSAFNFTNIMAWDIWNDRKLSMLNGNLVLLATDYNTKESFFSFLGNNECENTAMILMDFAKIAGMSLKLRFVTEESVKQLQSTNLNIEEDRGSFDYLFSIPALFKLEGVKFKEQRHLANRFVEENPEATFVVKNLSDHLIQENISLVVRQWENRKKLQKKSYNLNFEEKALYRLLEFSKDPNLVLSCVFLNNVMRGFSIDEILPRQNAMAHFIKADNTFKGIYEFLNRETAQYLASQDITSWNWQQDLDIENLRKTKIGYRPIGFLKKYSVTLK